MTQAINQGAIKATKAVIMVASEMNTLVKNTRQIHVAPRSNGLILHQPTFHWKTKDKHQGLYKFEIEVENIYMTNNQNTQDSDRVPIILN